MKKASPLPPAGGYPRVGTHHLRKFSFSYAYIFGVCEDLQQPWNRARSKAGLIPTKSYIRNVPDITFYVLPAGHTSAFYASIERGICSGQIIPI